MRSTDVLKTFAALSGNGPSAKTDLADPETFTWLSYNALGFFGGETEKRGIIRPFDEDSNLAGSQRISRFERTLDRLLSQAALHSGEQLIHLGWVWFAGTVEVDGKDTQFCFPAISIPMSRDGGATARSAASAVAGTVASAVAAVSSPGGLAGGQGGAGNLSVSGDAEITPLIRDGTVRDQLLERANYGDGRLYDTFDEFQKLKPVDPSVFEELPGLMHWCADVAKALGLDVEKTYPLHGSIPTAQRKKAGISMHMGCALYLESPAAPGTRRSSLLDLAKLDLSGTAFAKMYGEDVITPQAEREVLPIRPLSRRQARVAGRAGASEIAVVSGAPGTGKSHVLSVIARDAVARGESVLVVAGSPHAVDVLVEHFADTPGPTPVTFGGSRHGNRLAAELSELISRNEIPGQANSLAIDHAATLTSAQRSLRIESEALRIEADPTHRIEIVAEVDRAGDFAELREEMTWVLKPGLFKFGRKKRLAAVNTRLGVDVETSTEEDVADRFAEIEMKRDALRIIAAGGMTLSPRLDDLHKNEAAAAKIRGREITDRWIQGLGRDEKRTLAQISSAVTSNRSARRRALAALDPIALTKAAPLWVGSVRDVDEVLPAVPGLFDVVIFDEAAQVDQLNAASALSRAKRAIVCGDPNQLGHTSYVSQDSVDRAAQQFNTNPQLLNPRNVSTFDIAASQVPVEVLDEHFRSVPHLIEFSARRFYGGELHVATRHPANEESDHIEVSIVDGGARNANKVNQAEVDECLRLVEKYAAEGWRSIGLISPFRAQADAIEKAILERYRLEEIDAYGLRVGTVHSYQGDERDLLIVSLSVGADEADSAWRFINQKNLFNVMVTRARQEVMVVTSRLDPPGLVGEYLEWAEPLSDLVDDVNLNDPWIRRVAVALGEQGVRVRTGYRVGRHVIDVVAGEGEHAVAIECGPHPEGAETHMDRALMLRRAGWNTTDAYQTKWSDNPGHFAIELCARFPGIARGPYG